MKAHFRTFAIFASCIIGTWSPAVSQETAIKESPAATENQSATETWTDLLDAKKYADRWETTQFGGEGKVELENGVLTLGSGQPFTGITAKKQLLPLENYELKWEARRISGNDFFACVTVPIGEEFFSIVVGGWGGGVVGISSINNNDASENESTQFMSFENDRWYKFLLTVSNESIKFKVDDIDLIEVPREDRTFSTRIEVTRSKPLGYATFQCVTEVKELAFRDLSKPAGSEANSASANTIPKFMQIVKTEDDIIESLQTAVASYQIVGGEFDGAKVDLIGAVHVGEVEYYRELNRRFKEYDAVLFELVADPDIRLSNRKDTEGVINPVSSMQVAMKDALELEFQLDEVDYDAKNFVHADMSPAEFMADMRKRKDSFINMFARVLGSSIAAQSSGGGQEAAMLAAMMQPNRALALRRVFAMQFESSDQQMAGLADSDGLSTLVTERNAKAMSVLRRELKKGKRNVSIFFGAAHLDDMHVKLVQDFGAKLENIEWLTAWNMK